MDERSLADLEAAVAAAERACDVEVVLVVAERSGPYRDLRVAVAAAAGFAAAAFLVLSPWSFHPRWFLVDVAALALGGFWAAGRCPGLLAALAGGRRRSRQVRAASELAFQRQRVADTRRRNGVLVYLSLLEREATLLEDVGVRAAVPGEKLGELKAELRSTTATAATAAEPLLFLPAFLGRLAAACAPHLPRKEGVGDELPNAPVVLVDGGEGE